VSWIAALKKLLSAATNGDIRKRRQEGRQYYNPGGTARELKNNIKI
jgi:hypothetical protein